jgi:ATP-dependent Clp protease ATP-binding subunit ClpC
MSREGGYIGRVRKGRLPFWTQLKIALKRSMRFARRVIGVGEYPFEWFTEPAKQVLVLAQDESERLQQNYIGTEHLLMGLVRQPDGLAAVILAGFGLETSRARAMFSRQGAPAGRTAETQPVPTVRTKKAIENAFDEAQRAGKRYVGTEHLLLGIVRDGKGIAAEVLSLSGVTLEGLRRQAGDLLAQGITDSSRSPRLADLELEKLSLTSELALIVSAREAVVSGAESFRGEHLLLGILAQKGSRGARVLADLAITEEAIRALLSPARTAEADGYARMSPGLQIVLRQTFLSHQQDVSIDTAALAHAAFEVGALGGAIFETRGITEQKLNEAMTSSGPALLPEDPIVRFSTVLQPLWRERALGRFWAGRYSDARADFLILLANATTPPERAIWANSVAWMHLVIGDNKMFEESLALAEQAVASSPNSKAFRSTLAFALIENGRSREGVEILKTDGTDHADAETAAELTATLALGTWRMGDHAQAAALLKRAIQLDPKCMVLRRITAELQPPPNSSL